MAKKKSKTRATPAREEAAPDEDELRGAARWFVHVGLGVAALISIPIFAVIADDIAGFVVQFMAVQAVAGVGLVFWGISRKRNPDVPVSKLEQLYPPHFFLRTWREMDEDARRSRLARRKAGEGYDWRPIVAMVVGAICLTLMEYFGGSRTLDDVVMSFLEADRWGFATWVDESLNPLDDGGVLYESLVDDPEALMVLVRRWPWWRLLGFVWWSGWRVLGYFLIPAVSVWLSRQRLRDQGLEVEGFSQHAWIYGVAFCIVFVCVVIVSYTAEFSDYYPFYKLATRSWADFLMWEVLYAAQFFSLEFFFRGWWLKNLKTMMGSHAIFAMVVPYCMIHYGKPFPETMAAIVAGIVLGTLAMKTRSIWSGFLIHVSVAISMDLAALAQTTGIPNTWWPVL